MDIEKLNRSLSKLGLKDKILTIGRWLPNMKVFEPPHVNTDTPSPNSSPNPSPAVSRPSSPKPMDTGM